MTITDRDAGHQSQKLKWSLTGMASFLAAVCLMIGIPGFAEDLVAWRKLINEARLGDLDWRVWFALMFGFAALAVAPWVLPESVSWIRSVVSGRPARSSVQPGSASSTLDQIHSAQESVENPPLSATERELIQGIRKVWNRHGQHAASSLDGLFAHVAYSLRERRYWGELLIPKVEELKKRRDELTRVLQYDSVTPLGEVREKFNDMYSAYITVMYWVAKVDYAGDAFDRDSDQQLYLDRLEDWKVQHCIFADELEDLNEIPEHNRTLKIHPNVHLQFDNAFGRLYHDVSTRRERALRKTTDIKPETGSRQHPDS